MKHLKIGIIFIMFNAFTYAYAGSDNIQFVTAPPKGCKKVGQVVGFIDRKIYENWSNWGRERYFKTVSNPDFLQTMKKQAQKLRGNKIVIADSQIKYNWTQYKSGIVEYHFEKNTYTGIAYKCRK